MKQKVSIFLKVLCIALLGYLSVNYVYIYFFWEIDIPPLGPVIEYLFEHLQRVLA